MNTKIITIVFAFAATSFLAYLFYPATEPISPLKNILSAISSSKSSESYTIFGFAPYWNLKKLSPESLAAITHFAYFNLHLDSRGKLYTHVNSKEQDPGYTNYRRYLASPLSNKPLILTYMPESQNALKSILGNSANRTQAIRTIQETVSESHSAGVNVDFEPLGDIPSSLRDSFTSFIQELRVSLCAAPQNCKLLSISVYASAAAKPRIWDLAALEPYTDQLVVMTYDYTLPGESKTGPNSPLRGAGTLFEHDILTNIAEITKIFPSRKLLLGIPFYGYEWDASDTAKYTPTISRGSVASLERINQLINDNTLELLWDRNSLTPYAIRRENGQIVSQIYYEDVKSIQLKLELVHEANLGGIAIWALGYEGQNPELWETISRGLGPK